MDVTINLDLGTFKPYNKPNNNPLYVDDDSNHPPQIIRNLPKSINNRLTKTSSNNAVFVQAATVYQKAIDSSKYTHQLLYNPEVSRPEVIRKRRRRNITWYNPPYSVNVASNIGRKFLKLLENEFPKEHKLNRIFNRNTVKVSYSCTRNIKNIIDSHNKKTLTSNLQQQDVPARKCNCRNSDECPMSGDCLARAIVYQATVTTANGKKETYVGITENTFKTRHANHKTTFKYRDKRYTTELSNHIWDLKDKGIDFDITWKIIKYAKPYNNTTGKCILCLSEKLEIMLHPETSTLNKRQELISTCRHANKFLLANCLK